MKELGGNSAVRSLTVRNALRCLLFYKEHGSLLFTERREIIKREIQRFLCSSLFFPFRLMYAQLSWLRIYFYALQFRYANIMILLIEI